MTGELVRAPLPWHKNPVELAALWRWLDEQGRAPDDPAYFMERGEKWNAEREEMLREELADRFAEADPDVERRAAL